MSSEQLTNESDVNNENDINQTIGSEEDKEEPREELSDELKREMLYYYFYLLGDPIAGDTSSLNHALASLELQELEERLRYLCTTDEYLEPSDKSTEIVVIDDDIETVENEVENLEDQIEIEVVHEDTNRTYSVCGDASEDNEDDENLDEEPTTLRLEMLRIQNELSFEREKINILEFNNNNIAEGELIDPKMNEEAFAKKMMLEFRTKLKTLKHLVATSPHLREILLTRLEENALQELDYRNQQNDENFLNITELIRNIQKQKLFLTLILGEQFSVEYSVELETGPSSPELELEIERNEEISPFFAENYEKMKKHRKKHEACIKRRCRTHLG